MKAGTLCTLLRRLNSEFDIAGMSLLEYTGSGNDRIKILADIVELGVSI